jgi:hypothetical protein
MTAPTVLLVTTVRWRSTIWLARALAEAGFRVEAFAPGGHPLRVNGSTIGQRRLSWRSPLASLRRAVLLGAPDLIVPVDDAAVALLIRLHAMAQGEIAARLRAVIEHSLGEPGRYPVLASRVAIADVAQDEGLRVAETQAVIGHDDLRGRGDAWGYPVVLKTDGAWGGAGVRVAHSASEAEDAFDDLGRLPASVRVAKRLVADGDANPLWARLRRHRPAISAQRFIDGRPATVSAVCWRGEVLAASAFDALRMVRPLGPASLVRRIDNAEMTGAVHAMAKRLALSGFCGFDFMIDRRDGAAHFIELNPRATPTGYLPDPRGVDLAEALRAALDSRPPVARSAPPAGETIDLSALAGPVRSWRRIGKALQGDSVRDAPVKPAQLA